MEEINETVPPSNTWYLLPILLGLLGTIFLWIIHRDDKGEKINRFMQNSWIIGVISTIVSIPFFFM